MCFFFKRSSTHATWGQAMTAMGLATTRLERDFDTFTMGTVAVLVRPGTDQTHTQTKAEVERALTGVDRTKYHFEVTIDDTGHAWAVMKGEVLSELAAAMVQAGQVFTTAGLNDRVVAVVYPFRWRDTVQGRDRRLYWIFQPRLSGFTPFVPDGEPGSEQRDHNLEVRMEGAIRRDLPTHQDVSEWYPIWGMPV